MIRRKPKMVNNALSLHVPTSDIEPSVSALFLFAFLAFPNPDERDDCRKLFDALRFNWQVRDVDPKVVKIFAEKKFVSILAKGNKKLSRRQSAGRIALMQILKFIRDGSTPGVKDLEQLERSMLGWAPKTEKRNTTYQSKIWGKSRPALHLAAALVFLQSLNENASFEKILDHLTASRDDLVTFIGLAENIRIGLPMVHRMYSIDQFVHIEIERPVSDINKISNRKLSEFRTPPLIFGPQ